MFPPTINFKVFIMSKVQNEVFHDFCRFELMPFNPADLYNRSSWVWRAYERSLNPNHKKNNPQGQKRKSSNYNNNRRPQQKQQ